MSEWTLEDISEKLRDIDFAMLMTHTETGEIAGRPMSNNRDVEYNGDSYFFTSEQTRTVAVLNVIERSRFHIEDARAYLASRPCSSPSRARLS